MKMKIYSIITILLLLLVGCSTTTDPSEAYKGESAEQIFQKGEEALRDKNYGEAIKRFEALDVQYPFGRNTEIAQLHIIYAYYKNTDYLSAEAAADRFIHAHPTNLHVDYAYLLRGLANYNQNIGLFERLFTADLATRDLTQLKKAFADFSELVTRFPHSTYTPMAYQYMVYLRNLLANHQLEVAQFYFDHKAYVAAADRAAIVVKHYQGAPAVPEALKVMVKSYQALNLAPLADQTSAVLRYNYPQDTLPASVEAVSKPVAQEIEPPQPMTNQALLEKRYQPNGNRNPGSAANLHDLMDKAGGSTLFALHSKPQHPATTNVSPSPSESNTMIVPPQQFAKVKTRQFHANGDR